MGPIGREMDGLIAQARETRKRAAEARSEAARIRRHSAELLESAEQSRDRWKELCERTMKLAPGNAPSPFIRRYVVLVVAMQAEGRTLRRGDVVTNELIRLDFRSLVDQRLLDPWDYRLSELSPPDDPWWDGRWMG